MASVRDEADARALDAAADVLWRRDPTGFWSSVIRKSLRKMAYYLRTERRDVRA